MVTVCWSSKGGSGVTSVSAALALLSSATSPTLFVDLAGDGGRVLGLGDAATGPGVTDWLHADRALRVDALSRLIVEVNAQLKFLPFGRGQVGSVSYRLDELIQWLRAWPGHVVVDIGTNATLRRLAQGSDASLLVLRRCYLAVHAAIELPRPSGIIVLDEQGRKLTHRDITAALGVPVLAKVQVEATTAQAIDAGLLNSKLPRSLRRALRAVLASNAPLVAA